MYQAWLLTILSSDPTSSNYGKFMSAEEVIDFFAPTTSRVEAITSWLTNAGIPADRISQSANRQVRQTFSLVVPHGEI